MNLEKSLFFDSQIHAPWAGTEYGPDEHDKIARMLGVARIKPGMRIIEPGCGVGRLTTILADIVGRQGFVFAADISEKMTATTRSRIGDATNVQLEHGAIEEYTFAPQSFDVVLCHNVFPHFDDKRKVVAHLAAALVQGGRFIVFHFMNSQNINDLHRKTDPAVLNDLIPQEDEMRILLNDAGLEVESFTDGEAGYLLCATRTRVW